MRAIGVSQTITGTAAIIRLSGEIDLATTETTASALAEVAAPLPPPRLVVLDLTHVEFLSVSGARMLHQFAASCAGRDVETRLVADPESIVKRLVGHHLFAPRLDVFNTLEQALRAG